MPEPTTAKLVDKKTAAYEKQQAEVEEESRMKSLEQLVGTLMNNGKSSDTGEKEKDGDRLQQSVNTYEQISGQLDDGYKKSGIRNRPCSGPATACSFAECIPCLCK